MFITLKKIGGQKIADKITPASHLTSVVIDNQIYTIGGYNEEKGILNIIEHYNPETDSWIKKRRHANVKK